MFIRFQMKNYLVLIPARAGSQRLPGKNMRQLGDKPLVGHSLAYAQDNGFSNMVVTSNDARVLEYAKEVGVEVHSLSPAIMVKLFSTVGVKVIQMDRVIYGGLSKKDLPRGNWRKLSTKEIGFMKMIP